MSQAPMMTTHDMPFKLKFGLIDYNIFIGIADKAHASIKYG